MFSNLSVALIDVFQLFESAISDIYIYLPKITLGGCLMMVVLCTQGECSVNRESRLIQILTSVFVANSRQI